MSDLPNQSKAFSYTEEESDAVVELLYKGINDTINDLVEKSEKSVHFAQVNRALIEVLLAVSNTEFKSYFPKGK